MNHDELQRRLIRFTGQAHEIANRLPVSNWGRTLADQLIRSSTSVSLNYAEAGGASSKRGFLNKLNIVTKELRETAVNLEIISQSNRFPDSASLASAKDECRQLLAIFIASVRTVKSAIGNP